MDSGDNERHRQFIFKHWYGLQQDEAKEKKGGTSLSKRAKNYGLQQILYNHEKANWSITIYWQACLVHWQLAPNFKIKSISNTERERERDKIKYKKIKKKSAKA